MVKLVRYFIVVLFIINICNAGKVKTGWGFGGVPAINYNADDGFGYGVVMNFFNYKEGGYKPYYYQIKPIIFFTTGGKQDHSIFFDSPFILGKGFRINFLVKYLKENYYPYYGIGNDTEYNKEFIRTDDDGNPLDTLHGKHYYRFRTEQVRSITNLQKLVYQKMDRKIFLLLGYGFFNVRNNYCKNDGIRTKLQGDVESGIIKLYDIEGGFNSFLKLGIVWDSRDNEPSPFGGVWTEALVEVYSKSLGSYRNFNRLTFTDRRYILVFKKLVYAQRILFESLSGDVPFYMMYPLGGSFRSDEGLGGYRTIRGVYKNRYVGKKKFIGNFEVRYRFWEKQIFGQDVYTALNVFCDIGKVWAEEFEFDFSNLHSGYGAGLRIGLNENFIVYAEMGFSKEAGGQLYLDLGYLF